MDAGFDDRPGGAVPEVDVRSTYIAPIADTDMDAADWTVDEAGDVVTITLANENWWKIKRWLTRGDRRRIDRHVQQGAIAFAKGLKDAGMTYSELGTASTGADLQEAPSNPDEDDGTLLYGTLSFSHADSVTEAAIAGVADYETDIVLGVMKSLYRRTMAEKKVPSGMQPNGLAETGVLPVN